MHPLTDAFIKGRAVHKKGTKVYFKQTGRKITSCAVGAIYYGLYGAVSEELQAVPNRVSIDWPQIRNIMAKTPCTHTDPDDAISGDKGNIIGILIHLNDVHDGERAWNDTKLAQWLEETLSEYDTKTMS